MSNDGTPPPPIPNHGQDGQTPPPPAPYGGQPAPQGYPQSGGSEWGQPVQGQPQPGQYGGQPQPQAQPGQYGGQPQPQPGQYGGQPQAFGQQPYSSTPGQPGQPGFGGPGSPSGPGGPGGPGGPAKKAPVGLIIGGVVALLAIVALAIFLITRGGDDPEPSGGGGSTGGSTEAATTEAPAAESADAVVLGYLTALSEGDAETANSYVDSYTSGDESLLTDEVLAASIAIAPITEIDVPEPTEDLAYGGSVAATYKIGDTVVSTDFSVSGTEEDGYTLNAPGGSVYIPDSLKGLDITVNGVTVAPGSYDAFLGTYQLATTTQYYTIGGTTDSAITEPFESASFSGLEVGLNEEGTQIFRDTVKAAVDACMASTTLAAGCGLDLQPTLSDGSPITEGSIVRTLPGDTGLKLGSLTPTPDYSNPFHVKGDYIGSIDVEAEITQNGTTGRGTLFGFGGGTSLGTPTVDFSVEPKTVVWS